jgi:nicotinate-nucleotide adenylyltransferase
MADESYDPAAPAEGARIGLLGGSFNPAHPGHLHLSRCALKLLALDAVWWLVAPQNPLKPAAGMAPPNERLTSARTLAAIEPRIRVTDIEGDLGTRFTVDTIAALKRRFPAVCFIWLMGADNLIEIPRWKDWEAIFAAVPVAIFDRASYAETALGGEAARRFASRRLAEVDAEHLAAAEPPAWVFLHTPRHPASATAIRAGCKGGHKDSKEEADK